jgi:hypothetical protein
MMMLFVMAAFQLATFEIFVEPIVDAIMTPIADAYWLAEYERAVASLR